MSRCRRCYEDMGCTCEEKDRIAELEAERDRLRGELAREQKPWTVELSYDDGNNPFAREDLQIVDVGVSDHCLVVNSKTVAGLKAQLAAARAEVSDLESLVWDVWINEMRRSEIDKSIERIKQAAEGGGR